MFVRKGKFDSKVLLDPGPTSSRGKMSLSETSFVNGMDRRAMENCVNKTVLVEEANTEPDSSVNYVDEGSTFRPVRKRVKESPVSVEIIKFESVDRSDVDVYHKSIVALASEKKSSKRAETDSVSEDGKDSRQIYPASVRSGNSAIPEPIETSIVQNVSKLTKNFSLPGIQSVSSVNQTLWLPTIIASSAVNDNEDRLYEDETETSTTTVSQIILTGTGPHFTSHSVRNSLMSSKPCQISNHKFSPKVQILGGVTIPKQNSLPNNNQSSVASANVKTIHANYVNQSEMSHVNSSISSGSSKQIISNSFLNQISNKMPFATNRAQCGPVQVKCSSVINSVQMKSIPASVNRSINKINNNNNNNNNNSSKIESSTVQIPDQSGHVFSRVISTPKISLQSSGRVVKSGNIQYNQKPVMTETQQNSNIIHTHKVQSAVPVKIIQQQTISSGHKAGFKTVPTSRATIGTTKNLTYNSVSSIPGKGWLQSSSGTVNHVANPKTNSSFHKNITSVVNVQKINSKTPTQKMIVHQPTSQIIMSNSAPLNRINSQHYQGDTGNAQNIHYVQNYVGTENNNSPSVSCSQAITAQILQSFSQSKIVLPSSVQHLSPTLTSNKRSTVSNRQIHLEDVYVKKSYDQKRQIHGDPNTVLTTDDILGTYEERPRISDDSLPYHFHSLQLVMLDHTYAQTMSNNSINGSNAVPNQPSPVNNNIPVSSPVSPVKAVPHITSTPSNGTLSRQSPITTTSPMLPNNTSSIAQNVTSYQYNSMPAEDDDAASIISSIEGDRDRDIDRAAERHDSDTETAPEGEEEGKTRCVCEFTHDDGYMICCDKCGEWQHVDCMGIDRQNIPDDYMCDRCEPRLIDRKRARSIQIRKREELTGLGSSGSDSSSGASINNHRNKPIPLGSSSSHKKRPLTVTTYSNTISGVSRTIPTPAQFSPTYTISNPLPVPVVKKVPKRSRRIDNSRKIPKRKLPEKRKRKTSEVSNYRTKYCSVTTSSQISQWSESYELAKTNHYSPELRAKIARYSNRGGNNNPNLANVLTAHLCTTVPHAGSKILIATKDLKENSPIVELRGKYMLSNQHKPQPQLSSRVSSQRPGPFLFFYHLPKDSTQICIDTRTYGNEARFVRRSCKPNAELQHCIIKGTLHVYIVTINSIQSNTEISIRHDANGVFQPCACGNPKHCKQPGVNNSSVVHRNNGAASDVCHERRGRTRYSSSSNNISSNAYTKYDIFMKSESPEREKIEGMEIDNVDVMKREVIESIIFDKSEDVITPVSNDESPIIEKKIIEIKSEPVTSTEVVLPDKKIIECVKEEVEIKSAIKEEKPDIIVETLSSTPIESESEKVIKLEEPINSSIETDCKSPTQNSSKNPMNIFSKTKDADKCSKKVSNSRRTSVHSTRSTRASSNTFTASESADEKSDTQCDSKTHGPKEKKKLTREERKMEAIMKAFERMEKAELRRQENRDRQSKRRESDSQPPNSSEKDCKDQHDDQNDDSEPNSKRRRRKKGRSRTVSQSQSQRNRNRLNSIDSDMVTSGEESTSLLSPPVSSSNIINDCYSETTPLNSTENLNYRSQLSDTLVLRESVHRLKVGLSSACLLVEAAVGPLESTFKFPKTKKDMMNEWLNKSPERNSLYDNQPIDYMSSRNTNLSPYGEKDIKKSMDNVMKATKIISRLSGGTISTGSTPEKNYMSEQSEPENLTFNIVDSSATTPDHSPQPYSQLDLKKPELDYQEINISCDKKVPKRFRKGYKSVLDENSSPIKRSLRSNTGIENMYNLDDVSYGNVTPPHDESHVVIPAVDEIRDSEILTAPQPPQHSAKKRWLRQAISEESDSPTAESPPNEMVTPLKKRRLARESLSLEPPYGNCDDTQYSVTPKKDSEITPQNVVNQEINDAKINNIIFNDESAVAPLVNICTDTKLETIDEGSNNAKLPCPAENEDSNCDEIIFENKEINVPPEKCEAVVNNETSELVLSDLKFNLSHFSKLKGKMDSKDDACLENSSVKESHDLVTRDIKSEPVSNINSAETSGNSSPVLDDIDDIKKKIHSFHTENIQILQIRNKKQPKEKRKKVNLTFDLCVLADQTVGVKLKSEKEMNDTLNIENNPCPKDLPLSETPLRGLDSKSVLETSVSDTSSKAQNPIAYHSATFPAENPPVPVPAESHAGFKCAPLFSGSFKGEPNPSISQMPDINLIKNAIDMTTSLDIGFKSNNTSSSVDEYKNVQEILSHVNQMDSRNSVLLSGVLRDTNRSIASETNTASHMTPKTFVGRPNDPRLNPPPVEAPKPIRRKLSITEYRRRHSMVSSNSSDVESIGETTPNTSQNDTTSCNTNSNCMNSDDINLIVGKSIDDFIATDDAHTIQTMIGEMPKTVEDVNSIIGCLPDTSEVETVISEAEPSQLVSNETVETSNLTTR